MRIDAHHHFWAWDPVEYAWIDESMSVLRDAFGPGQLAPLLAAHGLDAAVTVQVRQTLDENRYMLDLARASDGLIAGVVGWVDLCAEDVDEQIAAFAADPLFKGVRHILQDEPDDAYCRREDFRRGLGRLASADLTYDILTFPRHLGHALAMVDEFPEQDFVVDHLSKPCIKDDLIDPWADEIRAVAEHPRVMCKISGMVTEADHVAWTKEGFGRYIDVVYEAFGEDRVMYGSDWPVCLLAAPYADVFDIVDSWASQLSAEAREKLFGGNAARFYRIG